MLKDIQQIIVQVRAGRPIVLLDDRREYEGDIFVSAEVVVPEVLQFMVRKASGLLCMAMPRPLLEAKGIPRFSAILEAAEHVEDRSIRRLLESLARFGKTDTPFHIPVDFRGCEGGISIWERHKTIQTLLDPLSFIDDFEVPGHLFTLGAHPDGLRGRIGHTETAVELCKLTGLVPAALLCELVGDEGEMCRGEDLEAFASQHSLEIVPVSAIVEAATQPITRQKAGLSV